MRNKAGLMTSYAFARGYVDTFERADMRVEMFMQHGVYHIRGYLGTTRLVWESFRTLAKARSYFRKSIASLQEVKP